MIVTVKLRCQNKAKMLLITQNLRGSGAFFAFFATDCYRI